MAMASEATPGLYPRLMGAAWLQLAEPVRLAHVTTAPIRARGRFRFARGGGPLARLLAAVLRLPPDGAAVETRLFVTAGGDVERWHRTFGDRPLNTSQYQAGAAELAERIGLLELRYHLEAAEGSLVFRQVGASILVGPARMRLPAAWSPNVQAREDPAGPHRISVHVRVTLPLTGALLSYDGDVELEERPR
jgi:hypothetical protein